MTEHLDPLTQILFDGAQKIGDTLTSSNTYAALAGSVGTMFSSIAGVADIGRSLVSAMTSGSEEPISVASVMQDVGENIAKGAEKASTLLIQSTDMLIDLASPQTPANAAPMPSVSIDR